MPAPHTQRGTQCSPAWSRQEVLDLLDLWEEEAMDAPLWNMCRNMDIYEQIAQRIRAMGSDRNQQQCHIKVKELLQGDHKAREANRKYGAAPQTYCFYNELHAICDGDPPNTLQTIVDNSEEPKTNIPAANSEEEEKGGSGMGEMHQGLQTYCELGAV
ncbi:Zinc finger and SCAN domain-containing protein 20 [Chelonia mydas]|uniref:Zinc finger and SCAN domain-containing protein 20 n=1 Tax=Chelonia mydas TaxID=8469 RepID=M7BL71_CHEMY|nr:Zinc finger and SCAN domain-containing protein 20 [Chelonia mydas]